MYQKNIAKTLTLPVPRLVWLLNRCLRLKLFYSYKTIPERNSNFVGTNQNNK